MWIVCADIVEQKDCTAMLAPTIQTLGNHLKNKEYNIQNTANIWNQEYKYIFTD